MFKVFLEHYLGSQNMQIKGDGLFGCSAGTLQLTFHKIPVWNELNVIQHK